MDFVLSPTFEPWRYANCLCSWCVKNPDMKFVRIRSAANTGISMPQTIFIGQVFLLCLIWADIVEIDEVKFLI